MFYIILDAIIKNKNWKILGICYCYFCTKIKIINIIIIVDIVCKWKPFEKGYKNNSKRVKYNKLLGTVVDVFL